MFEVVIARGCVASSSSLARRAASIPDHGRFSRNDIESFFVCIIGQKSFRGMPVELLARIDDDF